MTLDLALFRAEKGSDRDKMRKNQKDRFKDVGLVETVISEDAKWRQLRHVADRYNRLKNLCSKAIGEKMKKKEEAGETNLTQEIDLEKVHLQFTFTSLFICCSTLAYSFCFS